MKLIFAKKAPAAVAWGVVQSPMGKLVIAMTVRREVCRVGFVQGNTVKKIVEKWQAEWSKTQFSGGADTKNYTRRPVLLVGTNFQQSVWRAMTEIHAGYVTTYGDIARRIGKSGAARAVGAACGANLVPYLVPCHRVIAAHGALGGFSGGIGIKKKLLSAEGYL